MEREQILRDDFPTSRRGWDPDAVRAHLESLADRLPSSDVSLADSAAARVGAVIGAAEAAAVEIEQEAQAQADSIIEQARAEADGILDRARSDARSRVEQAQGAVESLVSQAEELRSRVGSLGESLAGEVTARVSTAPVVPGPELAAEPEIPVEPAKAEPTPAAAMPGPELVAEPEIEPEPVPEVEPEPEPAPEPEPELEPEPEPAATGGASTEDLIAQLKGGAPETEAPTAEHTAPDATVDRASVRLVALNMALEGADRDAIGAQIADEFGDVADLDEILDDVLARTG